MSAFSMMRRGPSILLRHRGPDHLLDAGRAGEQHHQAIDAERDAARLRHGAERGEKILIDRVTLAVAALLLGHLAGKTAALLVRIGELAKSVGEFHPAGI